MLNNHKRHWFPRCTTNLFSSGGTPFMIVKNLNNKSLIKPSRKIRKEMEQNQNLLGSIKIYCLSTSDTPCQKAHVLLFDVSDTGI